MTRNYIRAAAIGIAVLALNACVDGDGTGALVRPIGPPPGPMVTVTARTDGLAVSWTTVAGATSYNVLRGANGGAITMLTPVAGATSYVDTAVVGGAMYCYEAVGVLDGGGTTAASSAACMVAPGAAPLPPAPGSFSRVIFPQFVRQSGSGFEVADNPEDGAFTLAQRSSGATFAFYFVPFEAGDQITGVSFEGFGDGAVDAVAEMAYAPNSHTALTRLGALTITNAAPSWIAYSIPSFVPQTLTPGAVLMGDFKPNAAALYIGPVTVSFTRP